jgi:farnesyl-diphosphate farnesyltransferase
MLINKAVKHLQKGLAYIFLIPRRERGIRLFCIWPLLFAVKTLAISRKNNKVLLSEVKISRKQVQNIVAVSSVLSFSNILLKRYYYYLGGRIFQT